MKGKDDDGYFYFFPPNPGISILFHWSIDPYPYAEEWDLVGLAAWLLYPVPALKSEVSVLACSPCFQEPFCLIIRKQYLQFAVWPNGLLYSAYRQVLYLASFIPRPGWSIKYVIKYKINGLSFLRKKFFWRKLVLQSLKAWQIIKIKRK